MDRLLPFAFFILFPAMWIGISLVLSRMGGWARLAAHYPDADDSGTTYRMRSGVVGGVNYKSCLNLRVCDRGLRMSITFPFRIGHAPIFIPWNQFHSISEKRLLFSRSIDTNIGMPVIANVTLPLWIRDYLPPDRAAILKDRLDSDAPDSSPP